MYVELACATPGRATLTERRPAPWGHPGKSGPRAGVLGRTRSRGARHCGQWRRTRFWVSRAIFFKCRLTAAAFLRLRTVVGFS